MAKESKKSDTRKEPSLYPQDERLSRLTNQLFIQLKRFLPIESPEKIQNDLKELELGDQRLPLSTFLPFISNDLFPIKSEEQLQRTLSEGVHRAVAFIGSGDIRMGKNENTKVFASVVQTPQATVKPRIPSRRIYRFSPASTI